MASGIKRKLRRVLKAVNAEISGISSGGGTFARGMAAEGYSGGYADAIQDVMLALNGVHPNTSRYQSSWKEQESDDADG